MSLLNSADLVTTSLTFNLLQVKVFLQVSKFSIEVKRIEGTYSVHRVWTLSQFCIGSLKSANIDTAESVQNNRNNL